MVAVGLPADTTLVKFRSHAKSAYFKVRRKVRSYGETALLLQGKQAAWRVRAMPDHAGFRDVGFKVFSQWDEDGIIQYLISHVPIANRTFIEFGVENYEESTTRFLLMNDHWQGLVMDGTTEDIAYIQSDKLYWQFDLQAKQAWITQTNINELLTSAGFDPDVGLLSIDIDGNDYWIWQAVTDIRPRIVILEYNSVFGLAPISIPYRPDFNRVSAHHSTLYWGCSIAALAHLGQQKGYRLVGSNGWGHNAFFVRKDVCERVKVLPVDEAYVESRFRESRDEQGRLTYARGKDRLKLIAHLPVVNVITGETLPISSIARP